MTATSILSPRLAVPLVFALLFAAFGLIFGGFFPLPNGRMGHDFSGTLPALFDGYLWFRNNGLSAPWFSPSFCAGQPFFSDPQSIYYSLPQFLTFVGGPLNAAHWTLLISAALMFWGGYLLMRRVFATGHAAAVLVGGLLMFNGFLPHRQAIGHIVFHGFALAPWLALLLLLPARRATDGAMAGVAAGVLLAYWVHGGLGTLILPAALSVLSVGLIYGLRGGSMPRLVSRGVLAGMVGLGLSAAKLWAGFSFLAQLPRTGYLLPGAASLGDALLIVAGGLFLPSQWAFDLGAPRLMNVQWRVDVHEWAYGFTLAPVVLALVLLAFHLRKGGWRIARPPAGRWPLLLLLLTGLAWPVAFGTWQPDWNAFLKSVPILNSASFPFRWIIVWIPPVAVTIGLALDGMTWRPGRTDMMAAACLLATLGLTAAEPRDFFRAQGYDARPILVADGLARAGQMTPRIEMLGVAAGLETDSFSATLRSNDTFIAGVSQVFCYNPIFGYRLEKLIVEDLAPGPVLAERDGFLNIKNPACYVFPRENGCRPGDRFRADQLSEARNFVEYRPFAFNVSRGQRIATVVTELFLLLTGLAGLAWTVQRLLSKTRRSGRTA